MAENDGASKTEEPTQRKLDEARQKGDVPRSQDVTSFASLAGAFAVLVTAGGMLSHGMVTGLLPFIAHPDAFQLHGGGAVEVAWMAFRVAAVPVVSVLMGAGLAGAAAGFFQQGGFIFTFEKLKPDFNKVSPFEGFKRLFGIDGWVQFAKSALKIAATAMVAWWAISPHVNQLMTLAAVDPREMMGLALDLSKRLAMSVLMLLAVIALVDFVWQRIRFTQRMRMSKEELKEEYRNSEGDPHVKAKQKQKRAETARRRMMQAVPKATVVVMNPTHYAVALRYVQGEDEAPECVAKGMDDIALKIRAIAEENGVPVVEDAPLARALYAAVDIDEMIPTQHYEAVAKIISFIMNRGQEERPRAAHR
jgi:flagellar biosynthetic protein FlhB